VLLPSDKIFKLGRRDEHKIVPSVPFHPQGKWRANALNVYECDRKWIFLPLCPHNTPCTISALSIEIVKNHSTLSRMRLDSDEAEEHHYRPSGVIIIIFWSTEHK
jgi:hypothetical protein